MLKLVTIFCLAALACRMVTGRWPWELAVGSSRSTAEARARALLGVDRSATREAIVEAHRRLIARVHPDRGGSSAAVHAANEARDLLLAGLPANDSESR